MGGLAIRYIPLACADKRSPSSSALLPVGLHSQNRYRFMEAGSTKSENTTLGREDLPSSTVVSPKYSTRLYIWKRFFDSAFKTITRFSLLPEPTTKRLLPSPASPSAHKLCSNDDCESMVCISNMPMVTCRSS